MKTNELMDRQMAKLGVLVRANVNELSTALAQLSSAPIRDTAHGVVLEPLRSASVSPDAYPDRTGFEAVINKIHVEDYVDESSSSFADLLTQGVLFARSLALRLRELPGSFRVLMNADEEMADVTVRFHRVRAGEAWGYDQPSDSTEECIALWEVSGAPAQSPSG